MPQHSVLLPKKNRSIDVSTDKKKEIKWGSMMLGMGLLWMGMFAAGLAVLVMVRLWVTFWNMTGSWLPSP